ncbi:MAG TPA: hypothetical protein VM925_36025 [Labilithrix sp.]|nr:hypothetical protein [Labilithrix sp.]
MRSITLIFLGTLLTATLALPTPALAQKGGAKKTEGTGKKSDAEKKAEADKAEADKKAEDEKAEAEKKAETEKAQADAQKKDGLAGASNVEPPPEKWDITDVEELPGRSYFFVGLRYRGNVIPSFMLNMFVEEGKTIYTNMIGAEFDLRKDGFSLVPALSYHELGTGDILFKQKNTPDFVGNYSLVNSGMKVVYASVDLLWSAKLSKNVEFEYGAGFGLGAVFGDLENSWVRQDPNGPLSASDGRRFARCDAVDPQVGNGCNKADHQNSDVDKVNGYKEPSWFNGGSKPALFPWISLPQIGLRIKPVKQFVTRIGIGFALTGFWFGLNAQYGLEKKRE